MVPQDFFSFLDPPASQEMRQQSSQSIGFFFTPNTDFDFFPPWLCGAKLTQNVGENFPGAVYTPACLPLTCGSACVYPLVAAHRLSSQKVLVRTGRNGAKKSAGPERLTFGNDLVNRMRSSSLRNAGVWFGEQAPHPHHPSEVFAACLRRKAGPR